MVVKSNINEVIASLKQKLSIPNIEKLVLTVTQNVYASNLRRIHTDGKNVNEQSIGKYSITPTYINPKHSPKKFTPSGKKNKSKTFKNGKERKTRYFDTGYYGFRRQIGRDYSKVNLQLTGVLKANFQVIKKSNGYDIGFLSSKQTKKAEGLEDHFNCKIWGLTDKDLVTSKEIVNNFIKKVNA